MFACFQKQWLANDVPERDLGYHAADGGNAAVLARRRAAVEAGAWPGASRWVSRSTKNLCVARRTHGSYRRHKGDEVELDQVER